MSDANLNALWSRAVAEELYRAGCAQIVLCPGSRNSPLLFALKAVFGDGAWSWIDERGAAFAALGAAKACGRPVAVCVTSGTAVANTVPALCEAAAAGVPLLVLAADRPWEVQDRGAPQTMGQTGLGGDQVTEVRLGEPIATDEALLSLRSRISLAAQAGGPRLIHLPFRDPLPPLPDPAFRADHLGALARNGRTDRPFVQVGVSQAPLPMERVDWWGGETAIAGLDYLRSGLKGLIVCGADLAGGTSPWPVELARTTGFPLLADATAGLRGEDLGPAELLIQGPCRDLHPDLIIRIGPAPLARATVDWLKKQACPVLVIDDGQDRDWLGQAWTRISRPAPETWRALGQRLAPGDAAWAERWRQAATQVADRHAAWADTAPWSSGLAAHRAVNHPRFAHVHLAASMSLRLGEVHLRRNAQVHAARGVNGIDGCIAAFAGASRAYGGGGLLLLGDLAYLHDLNSLLLAKQQVDDGVIVVLDDDGGSIFDHLPVAQVPGYVPLVRTPQGADLLALAQAAGLPAQRIGDAESLTQALDRAADTGTCTVIVCDLRQAPNLSEHRRFVSDITSVS